MGAGSSRQSDDNRSPRDTSTHRKHLRKYRNVRPTASSKSRSSFDSKSKVSESSKKTDRQLNLSNKRSKRSTSVKRVASKRTGKRSDSGRGSGSGTGSVSGSISEHDDRRNRGSKKDRNSNKNRRSLSESSHVCNGPTSCSSSSDSLDSCPICSKGASPSSSQKSKKSVRYTSISETRQVKAQVHHRGCSAESTSNRAQSDAKLTSPSDVSRRSNLDATTQRDDKCRGKNDSLETNAVVERGKKNKKPLRSSPSMPEAERLDEAASEAKKCVERRRWVLVGTTTKCTKKFLRSLQDIFTEKFGPKRIKNLFCFLSREGFRYLDSSLKVKKLLSTSKCTTATVFLCTYQWSLLQSLMFFSVSNAPTQKSFAINNLA